MTMLNKASGQQVEKFPCLIELQKGTLKKWQEKTEMAGRRLFWHSYRR